MALSTRRGAARRGTNGANEIADELGGLTPAKHHAAERPPTRYTGRSVGPRARTRTAGSGVLAHAGCDERRRGQRPWRRYSCAKAGTASRGVGKSVSASARSWRVVATMARSAASRRAGRAVGAR